VANEAQAGVGGSLDGEFAYDASVILRV
jgi:hypothetical protein